MNIFYMANRCQHRTTTGPYCNRNRYPPIKIIGLLPANCAMPCADPCPPNTAFFWRTAAPMSAAISSSVRPSARTSDFQHEGWTVKNVESTDL